LRIALFTPFSPEIGGGSAQLRCHLRYLPNLNVQWYYLAPQPAVHPQNNWKWLGPRLLPGEILWDLSARSGFLPGTKSRVRQLVSQMDADLYWVVGHYEGISVAAELQAQNKEVHVTVHDDPFGTWIRSDRYKWFRPLLLRIFPRILRNAKNVDVTSWGMRNLYRQEYGVNCFSVYFHVPELPALAASPEPGKLTIGHIGTLYHPEPFRRFLAACQSIAAQRQLSLRIVRIGASPEMDVFARENPSLFESLGDLSEESALPLLASCDFFYAMYPPDDRYERFRRTSLPIKLSSYVQAGRPIFAHAPADSTLARIVSSYAAGQVCSSQDECEIAHRISELLAAPLVHENLEALRKDLMGIEQVRQLGAALRGEDWRRFGEHDFRT